MSNFNDTTPAPPANSINVKWQYDASGNVSSYHLPATTTTAGLVKIGSGVAVAADGTISGNVQTTRVTSGAVTPLLTDQLLFVNAAVTLPLSPAVGQQLVIYNYAASAIVVSAGASQTITGWNGTTIGSLGSITLTPDASVELTAQTATAWYITQNNGTASTQGYQAGTAPATSAVAGVVKTGQGISIAADGTISATGGFYNAGSTAYTMSNTDSFIYSAANVTLPPAPIAGQRVTIHNSNFPGTPITVLPNTSQNIMGWNGSAWINAVSVPIDGKVTLQLISTGAAAWYPLQDAHYATGSNEVWGILPTATSAIVGGVKQGSGVSIAADGTLSTIIQSARTIAANSTAAATDQVLYIYGTTTLYASPVAGQTVTLFNATTVPCAVQCNTGQTIQGWTGTTYQTSGLTSITLTPGGSVSLIAFNSTLWLVTGTGGIPGPLGYQAGIAPATATVAGVVKQGAGTAIAADGTLSVGAASSWQTWTPTVTGGGSMVLANISVIYANYLLMGTLLFVDFQVNFDTTGTAAAYVVVTMPVTFGATVRRGIAAMSTGTNGTYGVVNANTVASTTQVNIFAGPSQATTWTIATGHRAGGQFWVPTT